MTEKAVATVTIRRAGEMTEEGRQEIARWLRMHAEDIVKDGKNYAKRFTGRYMVTSE